MFKNSIGIINPVETNKTNWGCNPNMHFFFTLIYCLECVIYTMLMKVIRNIDIYINNLTLFKKQKQNISVTNMSWRLVVT